VIEQFKLILPSGTHTIHQSSGTCDTLRHVQSTFQFPTENK